VRHEEDQIQQAVVRYVRTKYIWIPFTCAPATSTSAREGAKKKKMGYCKGWPDLFFAISRKGYHGLFIELKTKKGRLSKDQRLILSYLADQGYQVLVCDSFGQACDEIDQYVGG